MNWWTDKCLFSINIVPVLVPVLMWSQFCSDALSEPNSKMLNVFHEKITMVDAIFGLYLQTEILAHSH